MLFVGIGALFSLLALWETLRGWRRRRKPDEDA